MFGAAGPSEATGEVGLGLMLPEPATVGTMMHVTAHPDDENNALLAMQSDGQGLRVVLATATRGNGGQNEIGPELFEALGVLGPKSCWPLIVSTARNSSSPEPWTSATRSASTRRSRSGATTRSSAITCG